MTETDILDVIRGDPWMMHVLQTAATRELPDWMIGAGFVRNKVWDHLHGFVHEQVRTPDIDLVYFDPSDVREETEKAHDRHLNELFPAPWSSKNQARMHVVNGNAPFTSTTDGLAHWVETPTCVAVTLHGGELKLIAPHGIDDLVNLVIRKSPLFENEQFFRERVAKKQWLETWPKLQLITG